jgi:hypothetical protein
MGLVAEFLPQLYRFSPMITKEHSFEAASRAYLQALATGVRAKLATSDWLDYGMDGSFRWIHEFNGRRIDSPFPLEFQLKASTLWEVSGEEVVFDLDADAYNKVTYRNSRVGGIPMILVLMCVPRDGEGIVAVCEDALEIKKCCYWLLIKGDLTTNKSKKRIRIPRKQLLSIVELQRLLNLAERRAILSEA